MKQYSVLIVEDELPAQANLRRALAPYTELQVIEAVTSVEGAVAWLQHPANHADIIFMDVELSDGMCFDIFQRISIDAKVVITTAYDSYAVKAFRTGSIDYLLKPINPEELQAAVERCLKACRAEEERPAINIEALREALLNNQTNNYKKRFVVKFGDRLSVIETTQIAYFYAEDKSTHLVTNEGRSYILDSSLDTVSDEVDPETFFRISRNCTASVRSIGGISKHPSNRLKVTLVPKPDFEAFVSRSRTQDFMNWLEGR